MLLPYQPDYKQEQLKVPGTAACAAAVASGNTCTHHSGDHLCQQVIIRYHMHKLWICGGFGLEFSMVNVVIGSDYANYREKGRIKCLSLVK